MLVPCDVASRAPEEIIAPIVTVARGPTRLYTLATNAVKTPKPTIATEPTRAEEKERARVQCDKIPSFFIRTFFYMNVEPENGPPGGGGGYFLVKR